MSVVESSLRAGNPNAGVEPRAVAHLGPALLLCLGVVLVYGRSLGFDYVQMDDTEYVLLTEPVMNGLSMDSVLWALTSFRFSNWHPLTWMSYMLDISLFGPWPGPLHAVNMALHAANTLLCYALVWTIVRDRPAAFIAALLFGVHALHVESVAWIAERKDVLCGFFYLLALQLHMRYAAVPGVSRYLMVQLAGLLALLSKPMAVTLPFALLLLDAWPLNRIREQGFAAGSWRAWFTARALRVLLEKVPLCVMALAVGVLTLIAQQGAMAPVADVSAGYRLSNSIIAYATYVRQMLAPMGLAPLYRMQAIDPWRELIPACAVVVAASVIAWRTRRERPWLLFGWLWFLGTLIPVIGLVQVGSQSHADRYMYLPSVGPLLAIGAEIARLGNVWLLKWRSVVAMVLVLHALLAWIQVGYWANPYMLYSRMLDTDPNGFQAHVGLSSYFLGLGDLALAERHGIAAVTLNPTSHFVYANLGNLYLEKAEWSSAEKMYRLALERLPFYPAAMNNLGLALEHQGRIDEARRCFEAAAAMDGALRGVQINLDRVGR